MRGVPTNLVGQTFGRLVVEDFFEKRGKRIYWRCRCECGEVIFVRSDHLKDGHVSSCKCLHRERIRTHNMSQSRPYRIWNGMWARCENPNDQHYAGYGGRGIRVCAKWTTFERFWADMQRSYADNLTLHRSDNDLGYCKENCVWATPKVQGRARRDNRLIPLPNGERVPVVVAAEITGITANTIHSRLYFGWAEEDLLSPVRAYRKAA